MVLKCYLTLVLTLFSGLIYSQTFNKESFYTAISSQELEKINNQLAVVEKASSLEQKEAYEGALLMKKAGLVKPVKEKLSLFKSGNKKLEDAIKENADNVEFRFLRLIIQEHAPSMLKYNKNIEEDKSMITKGIDSLPQVVKNAIRNYSKSSEVINERDLQ